MRIGVVVDSTCDLPDRYFQELGVRILPITLQLGNEQLLDERNPQATVHFYREHLDSKGINSQSVPYSVEQIQDVFLERLVIDYDFVFCITVTSKLSPIFEHASQASFKILSQYRKTRSAAGVSGPFSMRVIDSRTIFTGTALLAAEAVQMAHEGAEHNVIRTKLEEMVPRIFGYMVPEDLSYLSQRGFKKGVRTSMVDTAKGLALSVGSMISAHPVLRVHGNEEGPLSVHFSYEKAVETMLTSVAEKVTAGKLMSRYIGLSYAGEATQVRKMPGYAALEKAARAKKIELLVSMMSATGAVNVGSGCLFIAFAGEE